MQKHTVHRGRTHEQLRPRCRTRLLSEADRLQQASAVTTADVVAVVMETKHSGLFT